MELIQLGEKTYYSSGLFHVGIYVLTAQPDASGNYPVCLIDSGLDEEYAISLDEVLKANHFQVSMIINTHYHADHAGGNPYFKEKYDCRILSSKINAALISNYDICPSIVWGASRISSISTHYFYTSQTPAEDLCLDSMPDGLSVISIPGHCIEMVAVKTSDNVVFVGDAVIAVETIKEHALFYIYHVEDYLKSLQILDGETANYFVPYHADPVSDIKELTSINRNCVLDNIRCLHALRYPDRSYCV